MTYTRMCFASCEQENIVTPSAPAENIGKVRKVKYVTMGGIPMEDETLELPKIKNMTPVGVGIGLIVLLLVILQHNLSFKSTIVLPAGGTYLGPPQTAAPAAPAVVQQPVAIQPSTKPAADGSFKTGTGKFAVTGDAVWVTVNGNKYPYTFTAPKALTLTTFPNDVYDIYAISWNNVAPDQNVLIGVDNLNSRDSAKQYIATSKHAYVEIWWKQFGLKGVSSITEFTNSHGLRGYRAKYLNASGATPNDDVFFEVSNPAYVIHLASGILDPTVFDRIVDSVNWTTK